jgi:spore germination protein
MTYDWGFAFGPPMAVAPINEVRKVLQYAVTAIPRRKILMGIPNYGYDWTLPYVEGTAAKVVTNTGAVDLAFSVGANIQFDQTSMAPFFNYYDSSGNKHVVWFEDARSILAKLTLANEFNLGGVSYWNIDRYFPQNWLIVGSVYQINKVL